MTRSRLTTGRHRALRQLRLHLSRSAMTMLLRIHLKFLPNTLISKLAFPNVLIKTKTLFPLCPGNPQSHLVECRCHTITPIHAPSLHPSLLRLAASLHILIPDPGVRQLYRQQVAVICIANAMAMFSQRLVCRRETPWYKFFVAFLDVISSSPASG